MMISDSIGSQWLQLFADTDRICSAANPAPAQVKFETTEEPTTGPTSYFFFPKFPPSIATTPQATLAIQSQRKAQRLSVIYVDELGDGKRAFAQRERGNRGPF